MVIAPKVRLADVLTVRPGLPRSQFQRAFNRIAAKHADFVICRATDYSIAAVIELDDQSHRRQSRIIRDEFVDQALTTAGIPILHVKAQAHYDPQVLSNQVTTLIATKPT